MKTTRIKWTPIKGRRRRMRRRYSPITDMTTAVVGVAVGVEAAKGISNILK